MTESKIPLEDESTIPTDFITQEELQEELKKGKEFKKIAKQRRIKLDNKNSVNPA